MVKEKIVDAAKEAFLAAVQVVAQLPTILNRTVAVPNPEGNAHAWATMTYVGSIELQEKHFKKLTKKLSQELHFARGTDVESDESD